MRMRAFGYWSPRKSYSLRMRHFWMCLPAKERKRERRVEKRMAGPSGPYLQDIHVL